MDYVVIGGDERFAYLAQLLKNRGNAVCTLDRSAVPGVPCGDEGVLERAQNVVVNLPVNPSPGQASVGKMLGSLLPHARLWLCGPGVYTGEDDRVIDLWEDEALRVENAWLTAEGAIAAAMRAGTWALRGMDCVVIGWGRIGRALTELLVGLGARVTVASRSLAHCRRAVERGAEAVSATCLAEALPSKRLIFNTAPEMVLSREKLRAVDANAMIIDLASKPYGVDLRAAWELGLRAWREPGLPGRYCPESAAMALLNAMERRK